MNARIGNHVFFLLQVQKNRQFIEQATFKQIGLLVEIVYNVLNNKIFLSKTEHDRINASMKLLTSISKTRNPDEARHLLLKLDQSTLKSVIKPVLILYGLK